MVEGSVEESVSVVGFGEVGAERIMMAEGSVEESVGVIRFKGEV